MTRFGTFRKARPSPTTLCERRIPAQPAQPAPTIALALLALVVAGGPAAAEGPATRAEELVVTATRIPTPAREVANTITVIDGEEIDRRQMRSIGDALLGVPGLSVIRDGGPGKATAVFSRGTEANHTLVLIDGIEMNDPSTPDGRFDFSDLLLNDVARIEVLHGPQGMLYGADAIGAVVNIVTKKGEGPPTASLAAEGGSFETVNEYGRLSGGTSLYNYAFHVQHLKTDGITALDEDRFATATGDADEDSYDNLTFGSWLGLTPFDWVDADVSGRYTRTFNELDLNSSSVADDEDSESRDEKIYVGGNLRVRPLGRRTEHRFGLTRADITRRNEDDIDSVNRNDFLRSKFRGTKTKLDLQNDVHWSEDQTLTVGIETEEETINSKNLSISTFGTTRSGAKKEARNYALYAQEQFGFFDRLFGAVGARVDDHESFGSAKTYRAAAAYLHPETGTKLKSSYATGFKAPALDELFGSSVSAFSVFRGNPNLQPERSRGWEAGIEQLLWGERVTLGLTYYENDIKNLITFTSNFSSNENRDLAETRGFEAFGDFQVTDRIAVYINYAFTRAEDAVEGEDLLRRPNNKVTGNLVFRPREDVTLTGEGIYVGSRWDTDASLGGRIRRGGYTVGNVRGSYRMNDLTEAFVRIDNVLDKDYEEPDGFQQPGRAAYVGVRATY